MNYKPCQNIITRTSISQIEYFLESHGIRVKNKKYKCFQHNDSNPSASIFQAGDKSKMKCFTCQKNWDILDAYMQLNNVCEIKTAIEGLLNSGYVDKEDISFCNNEEQQEEIDPNIERCYKYKFKNSYCTKVRTKQKSFYWYYQDANKNKIRSINPNIELLVFNLKDSYEGEAVYVLEGEKDVERARNVNVQAIHIEPHSIAKEQLYRILKSARKIIVLLDYDNHGAMLTAKLREEFEKRTDDFYIECESVNEKTQKDKVKTEVIFANHTIASTIYSINNNVNKAGFDFVDLLEICGRDKRKIALYLKYIIERERKMANIEEAIFLFGAGSKKCIITRERTFNLKNLLCDTLILNQSVIEHILRVTCTKNEQSKIAFYIENSIVYNSLEELFLNEIEEKGIGLQKAEEHLNYFCTLFTAKAGQEDYSKKVISLFLRCSLAKLVDYSIDLSIGVFITGEQGVGKTVLCRSMTGAQHTAMQKYTASPEAIDSTLRGIDAFPAFYTLLEEHRSVSSSCVDTLKSFMSTRKKIVRFAYSKKEEEIVVFGNVLGSSNKKCLLNDETGSRRFFVFTLETADIKALLEISPVYLNACVLVINQAHGIKNLHKEIKALKNEDIDVEYSDFPITTLLSCNYRKGTFFSYSIKQIKKLLFSCPFANDNIKELSKNSSYLKMSISRFLAEEKEGLASAIDEHVERNKHYFDSGDDTPGFSSYGWKDKVHTRNGKLIRNSFILPLIFEPLHVQLEIESHKFASKKYHGINSLCSVEGP